MSYFKTMYGTDDVNTEFKENKMSRECDTCSEYKDYHCEKWCTVIRQTIADMEEDWIPINWIEDWLSDRSILWDTPSETSIKQMIADWEAEKKREKQNGS